jgi:protein phosphatase
VYRFTGGTLVQVTVDHSAVEEMVAAGHIAREQARHHPRRNVVTRSLGSYPAPDADVWVLDPVVGDRFLICSDGLTGELDDPEIAQVLATEQDPQAAADRLVSQARQAGGADNITTIVVALASAG